MKVKTSELTGAALDWAVTHIQHPEYHTNNPTATVEYSTEWDYGGPIIEREGISVASDTAGLQEGFVWFATCDDILVDPDEAMGVRGPTPLIAAMRCYVASKLGDEVEIPEDFVEKFVFDPNQEPMQLRQPQSLAYAEQFFTAKPNKPKPGTC